MTFRKMLLTAAVISMAGAGAAAAQEVIIGPDDEVIVREYIVKQPRGEVVLPEDYDVVIGEPLPETVTVTPLDAPGLSARYEYVVLDDETLIIDPETRRVVQVLR